MHKSKAGKFTVGTVLEHRELSENALKLVTWVILWLHVQNIVIANDSDILAEDVIYMVCQFKSEWLKTQEGETVSEELL